MNVKGNLIIFSMDCEERKDVRKLFNDLHQDMLRKMVRNTYTMIILYIIVIIETICLIFF